MILFDNIEVYGTVSHGDSEVLHCFGIAVRAVVGANAGGGEIQT